VEYSEVTIRRLKRHFLAATICPKHWKKAVLTSQYGAALDDGPAFTIENFTYQLHD
jgi:hypothetical protein